MEKPKKNPLNTARCLEDEELLPYARDSLPNRRQQEAIIHIAECMSCVERVRRVKAEHRIFPCDGN